jgi:hypothetical protein
MMRIVAIPIGIFAAVDWYAQDGKYTHIALATVFSEWHRLVVMVAQFCGCFSP